jgi:cation-transporting P-type ATPase I
VNPLGGFTRLLPSGRSQRRIWRDGSIAHIEVRAVHRSGTSDLVAAVEQALARHPAVAWARVVPAVGRVLVQLDDEDLSTAPLVALVEQVERDHGVAGEPFPADRPDHPGDHEPFVRELVALVADGLGVGAAVTGRLARLARLPVEAAALIPYVQAQPWLRHRLDAALGTGPVDVGLAVTSALASALSQGPLGLVVDAGRRVLLLREIDGANRVWRERAPELTVSAELADRPAPGDPGGPAVSGGPAPETGGGPPATPADVYADRAGVASLIAAAGTLLASGQLRRASGVMLAGMPRAAREGVEAFAACLHRVLADRGVLCFDPGALRRLGGVDTIVVEAALLGPDSADGADGADDGLAAGARTLVDAAHAADCMVVVAGGDDALLDRLGADLLVDGDDGLTASVHMLQDDGCGVLLVARSPSPALRAAGCSLGVLDDQGRPPWGAHLIAGERGLADASFLVDAVAVAHEVSRQSTALSLGGSGLGALLAATAPSPAPAPGRALAAVNMAALAAMGNGVRAAAALARHRVASTEERPPWHALPADQVLALLESGTAGLTDDEAARRRAALPAADERRLGLYRAFVEELANPLAPVLAAGAGLAAAAGSPSDAALVGSVVGLNALIGAAQRVRVDRAVSALEDATDDGALQVRRAGELRSLAAADLVPGDIVVLESGDAVPADCRLLKTEGLELDESSLTGESLPVAKRPEPSQAAAVADRSSMVYEGTAVAAGAAEAVVVEVGAATEAGRAAAGESVIARGVEERLGELSRVTVPVAVAGGMIVSGAALLRTQSLRQAISPGVSLAVAAVPEGLPLLATVAQLAAARRMSARGALARNPQAIETLGRVDMLCVDKTGTLTGGAIRLGVVTDGEDECAANDLSPGCVRIVAASVRASPEARAGVDLPHLTDRAVLEGAAAANVTVDEQLQSWTRQAELPFEPGRGYHAVLGRNGRTGLLCVKGAPEVVLPRCDTWAHPAGSRPLDDRARERLEETVERLARRGHRVLAVAERETSDRRDLEDDRVHQLQLLGFLGLVDPVRPEATDGVARLQQAGLRVVMVTGDHPSTAEGIARELGIANAGQLMTGVVLDELSDEKLDLQLDAVTVFARVTPSHKVRIVEAYRRLGHTVAMTGDGANDAPAIRLADVGVALGENATPAARGAADLVVPDGRVETIVAAIVEGRSVWGSVRDALAILLGGNLGEMAFTVVGSVAGGRPPITPRQLLLVNLMTDVAPGMAIALRPPLDVEPEDLLREGPDASLGSALHRAILVRALATSVGAGMAWTCARLTGLQRRATTVALAGLVGAQLGQTLVSGGRDPLVVLAALGSAALLVGIVQTPGLSQFFDCTPLGPLGWGIAVGSSVAATALAAATAPLLDRVLPAPGAASGSGHPAT